MTISISRKQVTDLARNIDIPGKSYNQKLDIVAASFGFPNQAAMMAVLNRESVTAPETDLLSGTIADWMTGDEAPIKAPIKGPVAFVVRRDGPCSLDVHVGGYQHDYTAAGGSSIRIERRGELTRFMLYDACCDMPRIFDIPDFGPMREAPSDWKSTQRYLTEVTIVVDATAYFTDSQGAFEVRCRSGKSEEIDALPWMDMDSAPRDGSPFYAHSRRNGRIVQIRAVRFDAPDDRFPIGNDGKSWSIAPEKWLPLDHPEANGLLTLVRIDLKPEMPIS